LGAKVALDSSGAALQAALAEGVFLVKPNLRELRELTGAALTEEASRIEACRSFAGSGKAELVALTLGADGALLASRERVWKARGLPIKPKSTVGAGDSFLGAMVWSLAAGHANEEAFRYGIAAGSAALLSPGTELARREDVERLVRQVEITEVG
jgi:6-phosphofructokinase 2